MKTHDFNNSIVLGDQGEEIMRQWLLSRPNVAKVESVASDPKYQHQDIDFLVTTTQNTTYTVEVKTDAYITGNIFFETLSNVEAKVPGCMYKTKADFLLYYFINPRYDKVYMIRMQDYRDWFKKAYKEMPKHFTEKTFLNKGNEKRKDYHSRGYTISLAFLEKDFKHYRKFTDIRKSLNIPLPKTA